MADFSSFSSPFSPEPSEVLPASSPSFSLPSNSFFSSIFPSLLSFTDEFCSVSSAGFSEESGPPSTLQVLALSSAAS